MNISLVSDQEALEDACKAVLGGFRVGLDVETTLRKFDLRVIQMATEDNVYVIDALAIQDPTPIIGVLGSSDVLKIIHNASFEKGVFRKIGIKITNIFDTMAVSRKIRKGQKYGLAAVCQRELGITINKELQMSDWSKRPLSKAQIEYAALDAHVLLGLHDALRQVDSSPDYYDAQNDLGLQGGTITDIENGTSEDFDYSLP